MDPKKVRSKDHIDLTFMFARLQEDGYLTRDDVERLKEIAERIEEPKLEWLAEDLRYIGEGRFIPADKTSFITELDAIRYQIHRIVESGVEATGGTIDISEPELLAAIPEACCKKFRISADEWSAANVVTRYFHLKERENEVDVKVVDELDAQKREIVLSIYGLIRTVEELEPEIGADIIEKGCPQMQFDYGACYIHVNTECRSALHRTPEGEEEYVYFCDTDLKPAQKRLERQEYQSLKKDIVELFEDYRCFGIREEGGVLKAICDSDVKWEIYDYLTEIFEWEIREEVEKVYTEELLLEYKDQWKSWGEKLPIPVSCEVEYAYPHGTGFFYYVRCSGSKDYSISLDEIAKSYNDLHETLQPACEELQEAWW